MSNDKLMEDAVVAVTGAGSGIGQATAVRAAAAGASGLLLVDRDRDGLCRTKSLAQAAVRAVGAAKRSAARADHLVDLLITDVTSRGAGAALVKQAVASFGRLDAAVNAAGTMGRPAALTDQTVEEFAGVFDVNVFGLYDCLRAELTQMCTQGSGSIVNIASASVDGVHGELGAYVASKAAVVALSRVAAKEAGRFGVRVNAVSPGLTDTPMLAESRQLRPATEDIAAAIPLGRVGRPYELANAIVWLCSAEASFTNGAVLVVDGGRTG